MMKALPLPSPKGQREASSIQACDRGRTTACLHATKAAWGFAVLQVLARMYAHRRGARPAGSLDRICGLT